MTAGDRGQHLFVYGTLLDPATLERAIGHPHWGERLRARVHGFESTMVDGWEYPLLVMTHGGHADGVLVMDLTGEDLAALDAYEDVAEGCYQRIAVDVETWGCGPRPALVRAHTYLGGPVLAARAEADERRL